MRMKKILAMIAIVSSALCFSACGTSQGGAGFNLFSPEQDVELGKQTVQEIADHPSEYPILPESSNPQVYQYVRGIAAKLLNTGKVNYQKEFAWDIKVINDDKTLNAFCTPGGYIYVYTGLIKYLDSEDQLAGVMGHEMAHAALRHSTNQMSKVYGLAALSSIITGSANPGLLEQIALSLISLKFSRSNEAAADEHSVIYLCDTNYNAAGAAGFFIKLEANGQAGGTPAFLSTHPDPGNRIKDIQKKAQDLGCTGKNTNASEYSRIKATLK